MNNFDRVLKILQEDTSTPETVKLLDKILNHSRPEALLHLINRNFPLSDSPLDMKRLSNVLFNVKLNESRLYDDSALNIINRMVKDKEIKKEVEIVNFLKPRFNELSSKDEQSLYSLYSKLIGKFGS